jgi:hypothetical protein
MGQIGCYTGKPVTWDEMTAADFEFEHKPAEVRLDMPASTKPDASGNPTAAAP